MSARGLEIHLEEDRVQWVRVMCYSGSRKAYFGRTIRLCNFSCYTGTVSRLSMLSNGACAACASAERWCRTPESQLAVVLRP